MAFTLPFLPPPPDAVIETPQVLRKAAQAHRNLAELKGAAGTIPNEGILIDTLGLQEAKASSEIENIVTTNDELFRGAAPDADKSSQSVKEVLNYSDALLSGFASLRKKGVVSLSDIVAVQAELQGNDAGIRKLPGTKVKNTKTGEIVYDPPQVHSEILSLLSNLLEHFNQPALMDFDPLVQMAILHYQFESIHPFYDGNGRTGRILNLLYLVHHDMLDLPVLYMSRQILRTKDQYYDGLQSVRDNHAWEQWIVYMLSTVEETSRYTLGQVHSIRTLMRTMKQDMRSKLPKLYSQELLNTLFRHPYTKIGYVERDLNVSRPTATKYLESLASNGFVRKSKVGTTSYYINQPLYDLLSM